MIKLTKIAALSSFLVIFSGLTAHAFLLPAGTGNADGRCSDGCYFQSWKRRSDGSDVCRSGVQTYAINMTKAAKSAKRNIWTSLPALWADCSRKEKQAIPAPRRFRNPKIADIYDAGIGEKGFIYAVPGLSGRLRKRCRQLCRLCGL